VQRRPVGHRTHQHGVGRGLDRCERVERLQHRTAGVSRPVTRKLYSAITSFSLPIGASAPVQAPPGTLSGRWGERVSSSEHERRRRPSGRV
jgi:hypothetical protein